ncbi:hypothetical protein EJ04DRAFT_543308 [Polyplosphaeria fusca]|uniref:Putative gamma-glutamylcyclotransferase n=1 Tax=Polyplosphaeria fusca TaxID=682080 RepID=A0A9P4V435_9PLEO|nr:hypothetical protein EJ04DRAFT_543308 [Polyplosphaeria fusca]
MDYLDDLDEAAFDAFNELDASAPPPLQPSLSTSSTKPQFPNKRKLKRFLFKLEPPLDTIDSVMSALALSTKLKEVQATGDTGLARFCEINEIIKISIQEYLSAYHPFFKPTIIRINKAEKVLDDNSLCPTLGYDITLPHHRPDTSTELVFSPKQEGYPVWYFFYGTLADENFLAKLFALSKEEEERLVLAPARVRNGKIMTWAGKYRALVDSPGYIVEGWALEVQEKEHEDALLIYETDKYEVMRTKFEIAGGEQCGRTVRGCTFRFAGEEFELSQSQG